MLAAHINAQRRQAEPPTTILLVTLHDRVDSVCNGYHGAVCEHRFDRILNCLLRFQIDVSGSFVDQDDFTFLQKGGEAT